MAPWFGGSQLHWLDVGLAYLHRRRSAAVLFVAVLILLMAVLANTLSSLVDITVLYWVPIVAAALFLGYKVGFLLAIAIPVVRLLVTVATVHTGLVWPALLANSGIYFVVYIGAWYAVVTTQQRQKLREENLRLQTLRQTMVTVNDIVRNQLMYMLLLLDLAENGQPLTAQQIANGRQSIQDIVERLTRLAEQERVQTTQLVKGVDAVQE